MIIYTIKDKLFIHAPFIIKNGIIRVVDKHRKIVVNDTLENTMFFSKQLKIPSGRYLVSVAWEDGKEQKHIYLG